MRSLPSLRLWRAVEAQYLIRGVLPLEMGRPLSFSVGLLCHFLCRRLVIRGNARTNEYYGVHLRQVHGILRQMRPY